jgi:beta-galactosidase
MSNQGVDVSIHTETGSLGHYVIQGRDLLAGPMVPNFWRVPTDNDEGHKFLETSGIWKQASATRQIKNITAKQVNDQTCQVTVIYELLKGKAQCDIQYTGYGDGTLTVKGTLNIKGKLP